MHSTDILTDKYLGSGLRLSRSIKKHGTANHTREILAVFATRAEAAAHEKDLITEDLLRDENCLNCGVGGLGYSDRPPTAEETRTKMSSTHKRKNSDAEWKAKRWENHKSLMNKPDNKEANSKAQKIAQNITEVKALRSRKCTLDGVEFFPSIKALETKHGRGTSGSRSLTFRCVEENGPSKNVAGIKNAWADPIKKAARLQKSKHTIELRKLSQGIK